MTFCQLRFASTIGSVNSGFGSRLVVFSSKFVKLGVVSLGFSLSWESGNMIFCPRKIVSNIVSVNSGFCSRLVLSTMEWVHLGFCHLGIFPLGSLAT